MQTHPLQTKRAYVCGSTQGIGRACAEALAAAGATITLIARNAEALEINRDQLSTECGQQHDFIAADFADWNTLERLAHGHVAANGPIHILVNNTGGPSAGPAIEAPPQAFIDGFQQHLVCNQVLVQAVAPGMREAV